MNKLIRFVLIFFTINSILGQTWPADTITVDINSGNPRFPFPQFNEYAAGKSLAAHNAVGVTHADMEKAMREGYQIMMHRALKVPGRILNGVQYIIYNNATVEKNWGTFVSEGDGYAMLAAAYFADKKTFDGLWLWVHDNRLNKVKKYFDCTDLRPTYRYSPGLAGWKSTEATSVFDENPTNSAADGDVDIALALVMAHKQWGDLMGIKDACGNDISYKDEALKMVKALVDTFRLNNTNGAYTGHMSGVVGVDGYLKGGNTWDEITNWRYGANNTMYPWAKSKPEAYSNKNLYTDYNAPAYFNQFAKFLSDNGGTQWQINQCLRAEASGDWIMGQINAKPGLIPISCYGSISDDGTTTTFLNFTDGEDFRLPWRTILNYVWHGTPTTTWDASTHTVTAAPNNFEKDIAVEYSEFLKVPKTSGASNVPYCAILGASPDPACPEWKGVVQLTQGFKVDGTCCNGAATRKTLTNYVPGTGAGAAVASEDLDLTAELYRQNEILWDDANTKANGLTDAQRYIQSTPAYFHDWFRVLGMLTASGNLHAPENMVATANMKVYMAVDKTFAYEGDLITYTVSYRNYGSIAATNVNITTVIDSDYELVSASDGGVLSGSAISWNIGTVAGFQTTTGVAITKGTRTFVVKVKPAPVHARVCLTSTITANNSLSWTSNEYPNNASYTMERNCVDLLKERILQIKKTTDRPIMNSGDIVNFKLEFENKTGSDLWLNGGRDRVVVSYANFYPNNGTSFYQFYRIWHTAHEAYINLGNYRVSYFMNDGAAIGEYDATTNPTGWITYVDNQNDLDKYGYNPQTLPANQRLKFAYEKIPWGSDANGSWNQRVVTQFAHVLSAPSSHIFDKLDHMDLIHKGVVGPGFTRTRFESSPSSILANRITDDWSYSTSVNNGTLDGQAQRFFPISPTYTDATIDFAPVVVNNYSKDICNPDVPNYERVLVEEFDGYTWRRIAGLGPLPGRETYNVTVTDSIPIELQWSKFTDDLAVGVKATYTPLAGHPKFSGYVKWTIPVMMVGEKGDLSFETIAKSPCAEKNFVNTGWIWSDVDSPDSSTVALQLTCTKVPPPQPTETSLDKTADKTHTKVGETIKYTLTFKNSDGSTATWDGSSVTPADWQTLGANTTLPQLNESTISLDQNNNNAPGSSGYSFGHKKSHGKNGYTEATITKTNASALSMIYRYQSGTPGNANFVGLRLEITPGTQNVINFTLYNNNTPLPAITNVAYPGSDKPFNIRTELVDDKLYIWVNDFTGAPLKVISGITEMTEGYAGIYANNSQQAISAYKTHWDSSFDLAITDPVPASLDVIASSISNGGTLNTTTNLITWPTIPGPILAGEVITRTFEASVNTCTDFITNIGKASVYGIADIQSQYVVSCATPTAMFFTHVGFSNIGLPSSLEWSVGNAEKGKFLIMASENNYNFVQIGIVNGDGRSINHHFALVNSDQYYYFKVIFVSEKSGTSLTSRTVHKASQSTGVVLYPNPFSNDLFIDIKDELSYHVHIYAATGASVEKVMHLSKGVHRLPTNLAAGIYIVQVANEEQTQYFKVVKE